jgi:NAD(P)-dependent dehydrogenase (short-subunit alcohol dehydrogenase family)
MAPIMPDPGCYDRTVVPRRFDGKVVLVTGSTGIAAASAQRLAGEGAAVVVASRTEAHCRSLVDAITSAGGTASGEVADLLDDAAADRVIDATVQRHGRLDGVFHVAGGSGRRFGDGPAHAATPEGWDATLNLNARTLFLVSSAAARQMLRQEPDDDGQRGAILHMGSVTSSSPSPTYFATHAYAASKGAIAALTRTMASYYAPKGIRVNAVAPGVTRTPMAERAAGDPDIVAFAMWKQPLVGGLLEPEHIAGAAAFLLSRDALAITGQVLDIDAGWSVTDAPWTGPA